MEECILKGIRWQNWSDIVSDIVSPVALQQECPSFLLDHIT